MSTTTTLNGFPGGVSGRISRGGWIESPGFDTFLLIFAPLVTLPIIAGLYWRIPLLAIGGGITLAFAHYCSTLSFYFWDENRQYHRSRWLAFFAGPAVLATLYLLLLGFAVPYIIQLVLFFWNTWHVARQNSGILSLYRQRAGVVSATQRGASHNAIIATSTFLAVWNLDTHKEVSALFGLVSSDLTEIVKLVAGVAAAYFICQLALALKRRNDPIGLPEGLFLVSSLGFFYPYFFIHDSEVATFAMLLPHYVQYMALVWLLHRRKFGNANAGAPLALRKISARLVLLIPALFAVGMVFYWMKSFFDSRGYQYWFESLYLLIALEHFYLDGLIWSFKRPHVRQTIGSFLVRRPASAPALR